MCSFLSALSVFVTVMAKWFLNICWEKGQSTHWKTSLCIKPKELFGVKKKKKLLRVQWDSKLVEVWDMIFFPHYCLHVKWQVPYKVYVKYICFPSHSHFYRHKGRENLENLCGSGTLSPGTLWTLIFRIKLDIVLKIIVSTSWNSQINLY